MTCMHVCMYTSTDLRYFYYCNSINKRWDFIRGLQIQMQINIQIYADQKQGMIFGVTIRQRAQRQKLSVRVWRRHQGMHVAELQNFSKQKVFYWDPLALAELFHFHFHLSNFHFTFPIFTFSFFLFSLSLFRAESLLRDGLGGCQRNRASPGRAGQKNSSEIDQTALHPCSIFIIFRLLAVCVF